MATSNPVLRYLESRKNLAGSACGIVGVGLSFTGAAGSLWPLVVVGLYGAGALIAPPERPPAPAFPGTEEQLDVLRSDFATLRAYLAEVELPPRAADGLKKLDALLDALLAPGWVSDPEHLHVLARAVRQDLPEAVDTFVRTRWWHRVTPGAEPPESHLERQLDALHGEAERIASALQDAEAIRQEALTIYLEGRWGS